MPGTSLLTLLDDVVSVLDDVAILTKATAKKTAGVLGDDVALNAHQVAGVRAERELPVILAVARGSARNKLVLVPGALALSALAPWAVKPLLVLGGLYLCFEGVEKVARSLLGSPKEEPTRRSGLDAGADVATSEAKRIAGAIRTDFVLSAEIVTIALGAVASAPLATRVGVLLGVAAAMTVGVYGLVAAIVKADDIAAALATRTSAAPRAIGRAILAGAPWFMKGLAVCGTAAMLLVGGGILAESVPGVELAAHGVASEARQLTLVGPLVAPVLTGALHALVGVVAGALTVAAAGSLKALWSRGRVSSGGPGS